MPSALLQTAFLLCMVPAALAADDAIVAHVHGLFQPEREQELRTLLAKLPGVQVQHVELKTARITFTCDPAIPEFRGQTPERQLALVNERVREASQHTFQLQPLGDRAPETWQEVHLRVAGLDCRGCAFAAYLVAMKVDGVQHALVSFRDGSLRAWYDAAKTSPVELTKALRQAQVDVRDDAADLKSPAASPTNR
jgi:cation transport ATPase